MSKVKVKDLILNLAKKAGLDIDVKNPDLVDFLSSTVEVPITMSESLNSALLTVDAAVEHSSVRDRVLAGSLGAIDNDLMRNLDELGLSDLKDEFKAEKSTRAKVKKLLESALEAERKKTKTPGGDKKIEALESDIARLNNELKTLNEAKATELATLQSTHTNELTDLLLESQLSGYDYADIPGGKEFAVKFVKDSVFKKLNEQKGKLLLDGRSLKLVKADTGGELFDDKHNKVELKGLLDSTVAPLLKKADPTPPVQTTVEIPGGGQKSDVKTASTLSALAAEIAAG